MKAYPRSGLLSLLFLSGFSLSVFGETPVKYSQVEFDMSLVSIQQLGDLGLPVDHHDADGGGSLSMPVSEYDIALLKANRIPYKLLIDDAAAAIEQRNIAAAKAAAPSPAMPPPLNFNHGTMGGYLTLAEIIAEIDEMRTRHGPTSAKFLVSAKWQIGTSRQGRPIYAIRISNNPDVQQNKRRIVYNTLTHAREPMAMMSMMWYLWYLFENYGTDATVTSCVDNVETYYIPVVNPDGYEYNRSTNPAGGGMWRKNRATNGDGTFGVDINRNYSVNWGNNTGSSGTTSSDTYRGTASFSEPENQAIRTFYTSNPGNFLISSNFHTYANKLLHPYGISGQPTNMTEYTALCTEMTRVNGWQWGRVPPVIGYSAAGIEIDWSNDVAGAIAVNPEQATSADGGFWPPDSRIDALALQAQDMNLAMCRYAQTIPVAIRPGRQVTPDFNLDVSSAGGVWRLNYRLSDALRSWHLTVYDVKGKAHGKFALKPGENSVALSRAQLPRSLGLFEISACKAGKCESVYSRKMAMGAF